MKHPSETIASLKNEEYCYLTTTGRVTGKHHEIEIWFAVNDGTLYLMSGGMDRSDWVKNLIKDPTVTVRIAKQAFKAIARIVKDNNEEAMARTMLADKYNERESDGSLSDWAQTALVVGFDVK
ncbi:MAG TPA: nitroreductase/quinone reductase family protein [Anaerolineales bacterium]|nr:nitroreductase/quinone reductase family protein [Anaerolineales bacterium]